MDKNVIGEHINWNIIAHGGYMDDKYIVQKGSSVDR